MSSNQLPLARSAKCVLFLASMMLLWMGCGGDDESDGQSQTEEEDNTVVGNSGDGGVSSGSGGRAGGSGGASTGTGGSTEMTATGGNSDASPPDVGNECVPGVVSCDEAGSSCRLAAIETADGTVVFRARCFASITAELAADEVCAPWSNVEATDEDPEAKVDPCQEGLACTNPDLDLQNFICQPFCTPPQGEGSTSCSADEVCDLLPSVGQDGLGLTVPVCTPLPASCDAVEQTGCGEGELCLFGPDVLTSEVFTRCLPRNPGTIPVGGACGTSPDEVCEPSSRCIGVSQTEAQCSPLCKLADCTDAISDEGIVEIDSCEPGLAGCPENFRCQPLLNGDGEPLPAHPTIASDPIGICIPVAP